MNRLTSYLFIFAVSMTFGTASVSARDRVVRGECVRYGNAGETPAETQRKALVGARIDALSREFGTLLTQDVMQIGQVTDGRERDLFSSCTESTVRGEWIADKEEPSYEPWIEPDGTYAVRCRVVGYGRELSNKAPRIKAEVLNAPDKRAVCHSFKDGDRVYVYMNSLEKDVYAMVCIVGEDGYVQRYFPYLDTDPRKARFKKGNDYVLLNEDSPIPDFGTTDGFRLVIDEPDFNRLYVIYSPNYFSYGPWIHVNDGVTPDYMTAKDFNDWLVSSRRIDDEMSWQAFDLFIEPRQDQD